VAVGYAGCVGTSVGRIAVGPSVGISVGGISVGVAVSAVSTAVAAAFGADVWLLAGTEVNVGCNVATGVGVTGPTRTRYANITTTKMATKTMAPPSNATRTSSPLLVCGISA
jgi:hypothetical protein